MKPTAKDVARMVGCSTSYLHAAAKLTPAEVQQVRTGLRTLIESKTKALPAPSHPVSLLAEVVASIGMSNTLDALASFEKSATA